MDILVGVMWILLPGLLLLLRLAHAEEELAKKEFIKRDHDHSCIVGDRRRFDYSQCSEYEECVSSRKGTEWEKKKCHDGYSFDVYSSNCKKDESCAVKQECSLPFIRLSCSELLVCHDETGTYTRTNCPNGFRMEPHRGCIYDKTCNEGDNENTPKCEEGKAWPTQNCRTFRVCRNGKIDREPCKIRDGWAAECAECDGSVHPVECSDGEKRAINQTSLGVESYGLPDDYKQFDCSGYEVCQDGVWREEICLAGMGFDPSKNRCTKRRLHDPECNPPVHAPKCHEGTRIAINDSCRGFIECANGQWLQMECPEGSKFNTKRNRCVRGTCKEEDGEKKEYTTYARHKKHRHHHSFSSEEELKRFPLPVGMELPPFHEEQPPETSRPNGFPGNFPPGETLAHNEPVLPSNTRGLHHAHPPAHPDIPSNRPQPSYPVDFPPTHDHPTLPTPPAMDYHQPGFICEGVYKIADNFDCSWFWDCTEGYMRRVPCPRGTRFDPNAGHCSETYRCGGDNSLICFDHQVMPTPYCGEYRICENNEWLSGVCPHDFAFINGKCDGRHTCKKIVDAYPLPPSPPQPPVCQFAAVRSDPSNPHAYLVCDYDGTWKQRQCEKDGFFEPRTSRCLYYAKPPAHHIPYHPTCYEGEVKEYKDHCTKYQVCVRGQFELRYCPWGSGFRYGRCDPTYQCGHSVEGGQCQESAGRNGYLADRSDCSFFYQCAQGKWVHMPCAPGTHFNPAIAVCDHIGNVPGCGWTGPKRDY